MVVPDDGSTDNQLIAVHGPCDLINRQLKIFRDETTQIHSKFQTATRKHTDMQGQGI